MWIKIAERLRPFSHLPGAVCLLPGMGCTVQAFPTLLRVGGDWEMALEIAGPVRNFTVQQNLEEGRVTVFGTSPAGFFRYHVVALEGEIGIDFEKFPVAKEGIKIPSAVVKGGASAERLSLGSHKAQDWELLRRRGDLREIFPVWVKLGGGLPSPEERGIPSEGMFSLLRRCVDLVEEGNRTGLYQAFLNLFQAGFYSMLTPRLRDDDYQGLVSLDPPGEGSPLLLLKEGERLIRSLFFKEEGEELSLLPCLPVEFHSGRYLNLTTAKGDQLDIEWAKKSLRRAVVRPAGFHPLRLTFPKEIKTFRVRTALQERGDVLSAASPLPPSHLPLFLDRFEK